MKDETEKNNNLNSNKNIVEIVPTVMPTSYKDFVEKINRVSDFVKTIQIDVMDGKFVPSTSWPYDFKKEETIEKTGMETVENIESENSTETEENSIDTDWNKLINQEEGIPHWQDNKFEVDLMVEDQIIEAQNWVSAGVDRVIFHIEAFKESPEKIKEEILKIKEQGVEISMALVPQTPNSVLDDYLDILDSVQFMGINKIGYQGQDFAPEVLEKISELHSKKPELPISIDGGVSFKTVRDLAKAGAVRLASGSTIFKAESAERVIGDLKKMVN